MYQIFLHISSITILEICFFFYYIGPLETKIFYNYIERLMDVPLKTIYQSLELWGITGNQFIEGIFLIDENSDVKEQLYQSSQEGKEKRIVQNNNLFMYTIELWSFLIAFTVFLFLCEFIYIRLRSRNKVNKHQLLSEEIILNQEDNIELENYRKNSTDEAELESTIEKIDKTKKIKKALKIVFEYSLFGGCIVIFQYLFFNYVVFAYKPLSTEEMEYYVYIQFIEYEPE